MNRKLKYGAHIFLWIDKWSNEHLNLFDQTKGLGLDVLEIAVGDDIEFDAAAIKQKCSQLDMELVISPGADWPMDMDISLEDKDKRKTAIEWHKKWISKGAEAGAKAYTGALYGHPGRIIKTRPQETEFNRITSGLKELAEYAGQYDIKIVLEPMSHFRTHVANTPEQLTKILNAANHDNLYVLLDTYHLVTEIREYESGIQLMGNKIWGVHACENDRGVPGGGLVPWDSIFSNLKKIGFDGYMILETYNSSINNGDFAFSRGMFHNVCPDGDEFVNTGLDFIKKHF